MSTSDNWTSDYSPCPCGKGKILEHVDSPDNPWSRMSYDYSIECVECESNYILDGRNLRNRKAHEEEKACFNNYYHSKHILNEICKESIDEIVKEMQFNSIKSEYRTLVDAGICSEGPIRYPRLRNAGKRASDLCQPIANIGWITSNLHDKTKAKKIAQIQTEIDQLESIWRAASKKEKSFPITSLKAK